MNLHPRGLYTGPPPAKTRSQINPTLLFSWFCTLFALFIILLRLFGRKVRTGKLFQEDKTMAFSIVPLMARMALIHVVLIWGTNNVADVESLTPNEIYQREIGSRLVLGARIFYTMFIWTAKFTVSEFLKRLTSSYWKRHYEIWLHTIRVFLVLSYIGVVVATLSECQPFNHYWQVVPDPGSECRQSYPQLFTMAVADIITDILLVVFPLSILIPAPGMPLMRRLKLCVLFALSAVNIVITTQRVVDVVRHNGSQQRRSVFASGEILAAAAVSNIVILGSFLRDRGVKKTRWRGSYTSDTTTKNGNFYYDSNNPQTLSHSDTHSTECAPSPRRQTMTRIQAGSDEDLFADMCYRSNIGARAAPTDGPPEYRPAEPLTHEDLHRHDSRHEGRHPSSSSVHDLAKRPSIGFASSSSHERRRNRSVTGRRGSLAPSQHLSDLTPTPSRLPKTVTFSDPGGLLARASSVASTIALGDSDTSGAAPSTRRSSSAGIGASSHGPSALVRPVSSDTGTTRAGTPAELQDVGGLLASAGSGGFAAPAPAYLQRERGERRASEASTKEKSGDDTSEIEILR